MTSKPSSAGGSPRALRTRAFWSAVLALALGITGAALPAMAGAAEPAADTAPSGLQTETLQIGPIDLAPQENPAQTVDYDIPRPEGDIAIRSISFRLVDMAGNPVMPHVAHLHHMVMLDGTRPDRLCSFPSASRFAATGMELTDINFPEGYAYHVPAGTDWGGIYHVMNLSADPITVAIEYTVTYTDASAGGFEDVEPYLFDVTGCWNPGDSTFYVPGDGGPGGVFEQSKTYAIDQEGTIVWAGGHIHAGGIDATLTADDGTEVCRSVAEYGTETGHGGHPILTAITPCPVLDYSLIPGDKLTLTARYHNEAPVIGAMGIMMAYVHEIGERPPPPPPATAEVQIDRISRKGLELTMTCNRDMEVDVVASVYQGLPSHQPVYGGSNYDDGQVGCDADSPTRFVLGLTGIGILRHGPVKVSVNFYWNDDGFRYGNVEEDLPMRGRIDLWNPAPDGGPNPVKIDRRAEAGDSGPVITGTVTCDTHTTVSISVSGRQLQRGEAVNIDGYTWSVECDGVSKFAIPVSSYDGPLRAGRADVTVVVWDSNGANLSQASTRVRLPRPQRGERQWPVSGAEAVD